MVTESGAYVRENWDKFVINEEFPQTVFTCMYMYYDKILESWKLLEEGRAREDRNSLI